MTTAVELARANRTVLLFESGNEGEGRTDMLDALNVGPFPGVHVAISTSVLALDANAGRSAVRSLVFAREAAPTQVIPAHGAEGTPAASTLDVEVRDFGSAIDTGSAMLLVDDLPAPAPDADAGLDGSGQVDGEDPAILAANFGDGA